MLKLTLQHSKNGYSPLPPRGRGGLWSAEAELPPDAEADASALKNGYTPLPQRGRGAGGEGERIDAYPTSSSLRPSSLPSSSSQARSGWGIIPSTLNCAFATPAIWSTEPFGLCAASNAPVGLQ